MKALEVIQKEGMKGFMARWKEGVNRITPLQQTQAQLTFTKITLLGILLGFGACVYNWRVTWWLAIIMTGAYGNTYLGYVALKQKHKLLLSLENECKEGEENV